MSLNSPQDVFEVGLKKLLHIKQNSSDTQNYLLEQTTDNNTINALKQHITVTQNHVSTLEEILESLDVEVTSQESEGADTLVSECSSMLEDGENELVKNLLVNEAVLKLESLEVAILTGLQAQSSLLETNRANIVNELSDMLSQDQNAYNLGVQAATLLVSKQ